MKLVIENRSDVSTARFLSPGAVTPVGEGRSFSRSWRGFLARMACCLLGATAALGAQPPIGFERWTDPEVPLGVAESGVAFGLTPAQILQQYAVQLVLGLPPSPQKDKRLIDIEVRPDGSGLANYVYDIVWIVNTGDFELDSWFLFDLKESEVHDLESFKDAVILDIERYPKGNQWRFAVILQRNSGQYPWHVLTSATLEEILDVQSRTHSRLVDIDYFSSTRGNRRGRSGPPSGSDAVLVANTGGNYVPGVAASSYDTDYEALSEVGFQVVDYELFLVTIWVKSLRPYLLLTGLTQDEAIFHHGHDGRIVDLEFNVDLDSYTTVNLP